MTNPYITGTPVTGLNFYGRQELVEDLLDIHKKNIYLAGNRRIGKTSLLRLVKDMIDSPRTKDRKSEHPYYQHWPAPPEDVAIFYNFQAAGKGGILKMGQDLARLAQKESIRFRGLRKIKFSADADLCQVITALSDAAESGKFRLVLLFDEAEKLIACDDETLERLRSIIQDMPQIRTILAATKRLEELYHRPPKWTSPFLNGFVRLCVSSLSDLDAEKLIRQSNYKKTVTVKDNQVQQILELAGTHPYLIQNLCFDLYQSGGELRIIQGSDRAVSSQMSACFQDDYNGLSLTEQAILHLLAQKGPAVRDELKLLLTSIDPIEIDACLKDLIEFGNILMKGDTYQIAGSYLYQWSKKIPIVSPVASTGIQSARIEHYLNFDLKFTVLGNNQYQADVSSPAGEAQAHMPIPEAHHHDGYVSSTHEKAGQELGQRLFEAALPNDLRTMYELSRQRALAQHKGLRLRLRIGEPLLADLPWELMYDPHQADFVGLSRQTPIVRYIEVPQPIEPLLVEPPLKVLCMLAAPSDLGTVQPQRERAQILRATAGLRQKGLLEVDWVKGQTWRDLQKELSGGPWHVFHFIGHGGFDNGRGDGILMLADDQGKSAPLRAIELGRLLADHPSLRLVLLNSCSGGEGGLVDLFSSTAAVLVQRGLPAVIAMQQKITNAAAVEFSRSFYEALAEGATMESCMAEARKSMSLSSKTLEWSIPALYLRTTDSVLFRQPATDAP